MWDLGFPGDSVGAQARELQKLISLPCLGCCLPHPTCCFPVAKAPLTLGSGLNSPVAVLGSIFLRP